MKIVILVMLAAATIGCSSTDDRKQMFMEGATACNAACMDNPEISEISSKAGGGIPLLFMGGMEIKCRCNRLSKYKGRG